jgi:hypothetical protein
MSSDTLLVRLVRLLHHLALYYIGEWRYIPAIDNSLPCTSTDPPTLLSVSAGDGKQLWPALIEKAVRMFTFDSRFVLTYL